MHSIEGILKRVRQPMKIGRFCTHIMCIYVYIYIHAYLYYMIMPEFPAPIEWLISTQPRIRGDPEMAGRVAGVVSIFFND